MDHLHVPFEMKTGDKPGVVAGYGSTFGPPADMQDDIVEPGAFRETIAENPKGWPMLFGHNTGRVVGFWKAAREDSRGLYLEGEFTMESPEGAAAAATVRHAQRLEQPFGLSIGYQVRANGYKMEGDIRKLTAVSILEVSLASIPANPRARVTGVKLAEADAAIREAVDQIENWNDVKRFFCKHCGKSRTEAEDLAYKLRRDAAQADLSLSEVAIAFRRLTGAMKTKGELDAFLTDCGISNTAEVRTTALSEDRELTPLEMAKALRRSSEREAELRELIRKFSAKQVEAAWTEAKRHVSEDDYTREITEAEELADYKKACAWDEAMNANSRRAQIEANFERDKAVRRLVGKITLFDKPSWQKAVDEKMESILRAQLEEIRNQIAACKSAGELEVLLYNLDWSEPSIAEFKALGYLDPDFDR